MKKIILATFLVLLLSSCGTRKVEKNKNSEAQKVEITDNILIEKKEELNVKVTENTKVDDKNETTIKETVFEPVNPNNPSSIIDENGKETILKNIKKTTKETKQKNNTKTDNSTNYEQFHKTELSELSESDSKTGTKKANEAINIDRKAWSSLNLLWLLIPLGLLIAWLNKSKIITWAKNIWWI